MKIGIMLVLLMIIGGALIGGYLVVTTGFVATTGKSFGPLVALVGLGAVAFLCVRKS
jgi:PGF-CTERM protein